VKPLLQEEEKINLPHYPNFIWLGSKPPESYELPYVSMSSF